MRVININKKLKYRNLDKRAEIYDIIIIKYFLHLGGISNART